MDDQSYGEERGPRPPTTEDLIKVCALLNASGARYVVIGGMAIINAGMDRRSGDLDSLVEDKLDNLEKVRAALAGLPDKAAEQLDIKDFEHYRVIRIADEIVVDVLTVACGVSYGAAASDAIGRSIGGVEIPFAGLETLWKTKQTMRDKDVDDVCFLRETALEMARITKAAKPE